MPGVWPTGRTAGLLRLLLRNSLSRRAVPPRAGTRSKLPKCGQGPLAFENNVHLNMGMVVGNREKAQATWGKDHVEKAIFMNATIPVIEEFQLDPRRVFAYFNLDLPSRPLITRRLSFPIILDIRTHLGTTLMTSPEELGCTMGKEEVTRLLFGAREL